MEALWTLNTLCSSRSLLLPTPKMAVVPRSLLTRLPEQRLLCRPTLKNPTVFGPARPSSLATAVRDLGECRVRALK